MDELKPPGNPQPQKEPLAATDGAPAPAINPLVQSEPLAQIDPAPGAIPRKKAVPRIRLERKHPLAIRWMHWINFPVLFVMIWSGLLIYWNDSDNAYKHPHEIYRIGIGRLTLFHLF